MFKFVTLSDFTCTDYISRSDRFELTYILLSYKLREFYFALYLPVYHI